MFLSSNVFANQNNDFDETNNSQDSYVSMANKINNEYLESHESKYSDIYYKLRTIYHGDNALGGYSYEYLYEWFNNNVTSSNFKNDLSYRIAKELGTFGTSFFKQTDEDYVNSMISVFVEHVISSSIDNFISNSDESIYKDPRHLFPSGALEYNGFIFKKLFHRNLAVSDIKKQAILSLMDMNYTEESAAWLVNHYFLDKDPTINLDQNDLKENKIIYGSLQWWRLYTAASAIKASGLNPVNYDIKSLIPLQSL